MSSEPEKIRQAAILAGGLGSRLGGLTRSTPKPLLEISGRPFLDYLIKTLSAFGLSRFLLLAGYRGEALSEYCRNHPAGPEALIEPEALGTAGALRHAAGRLDENFLLVNGDSLCLGDLQPLLAPFERPQSLGRLWLRRVQDNDRYGRVLMADGRVTGFQARAAGLGAGLMNAGVYRLNREILSYIPEGKSSLEFEVFPRLAADGRLEAEIVRSSYFIDIGLPEDLDRARAELPEKLKIWEQRS